MVTVIFIIAISIAMYVGTLWKCAVSSLYPFILLPFLYEFMKKKIICLPTYPNFSDRVGSGETKIFLNVALGTTLKCLHVWLYVQLFKPVCRKSMDSVDISIGVLERVDWTMFMVNVR